MTRSSAFDYVIDATELGDLLALGGVEYVSGAESQDQTGEPHAVSSPPQPDNVQSLTWCFPLGFDPEGSHVIDKPEQYERWRNYVPDLKPSWSGHLFSWTHPRVPHLRPWTRYLFGDETDDPAAALWNYRRIHYRGHYPELMAAHEVSLVNWPQNDYLEGNIIDKPADEVERYLEEAHQLSLSLFYWMQTEAPRPDGGVGYPGLYLRPDLVGTDDGLAMYPYIRESRRIKALFTVTENHVGAEARQGRHAERFEDSVGIGCYRIDLHPSTGGDNYIDISSLPFQIPLGALSPCPRTESPSRVQEHRNNPHFQRVLSIASGGVEHRRGRGLDCGVLPRATCISTSSAGDWRAAFRFPISVGQAGSGIGMAECRPCLRIRLRI